MSSEAQKRASLKYQEKNVIQISLKLNKVTDADIIALLDTAENKQGLIKELLRKSLTK